jgi:CDP-diacylglycerol--glycerol-3-phosphate 3-phosphatidyltransferase
VPTIYDLKPAFQRLLAPIAATLGRAGVTPNHVTIAALALSGVAGFAIVFWPESHWPLLALPAVLFVRMALNALDGMMARTLRLTSRLGAVLNELGDVISDAILYTPLALVPGLRPSLIVTIVLLAVMSEMTGVVSVQIGGSRRYDGPMGKSDRAFVFGALGLVLGAGIPAGQWATWLLLAVLALAALTIVNRASRALAETSR